jgi:orotidine-5'-phosphate decarboxylase
MNRIINEERTIVPACDMDWPDYARLTHALDGTPKIVALKVGISLALGVHGLRETVEQAHNHGFKVIYDHQKAGTDIHEATPQIFMDRMAQAKVAAVILFPLSGPAVQFEWTKAAQERGIGVIIGGHMTHPRFLEGDQALGKKPGQDYTGEFSKLGLPSLTGYIRKGAPNEIYILAAKMGVRDFVVPGNKPEMIEQYRDAIVEAGCEDPAFFAPGIGVQGGGVRAEDSFHNIVGRGLYQADDIKKAAEKLTSQL